MTESVIQSHVDYWHFQCQLYQFMVNIRKYGIDRAIELQRPKRLGHFSKYQQRNQHYIDNADKITAEMQRMENGSMPKVELKHAVKMLKRWKSKFNL